MTKIVLLSRGEELSGVARAIAHIAPDSLFLDPDASDVTDAEVAICWNPPRGVLAALPKLRLVHGVGAGIDNIISDPEYPRSVPLCRIVDPEQARGMSEFVLWSVLYFHRGFDQVLIDQRTQRWQAPVQLSAGSRTIGVMGLGGMGLPIAKDLIDAGFRVRGWSRDRKQVEGVESYGGDDTLPQFLSGLDMVVCVLPLTPQTRGLIDASFLGHLSPGARLIQVGRGGQVVIADVIAALNAKTLGGAVIDVFETEPLPSDHPAWTTPNLLVTPHMASLSNNDTLAEQIVTNIRRLDEGESLFNQVSLAKGF
jgi:glyoxylate/hydroxypyruvate reductase A